MTTNNRLAVLYMAAAGALAQLVSWGLLPILTRLYTPAVYGNWLILGALVTVAGPLSTLRYELAIVMAKEEDTARDLFWASFFLSVPVCAVAGLAMFLLRDILQASTGIGTPEIVALTGQALAAGWGATLLAWATRRRHFAVVALYTALLPVGTLLFQIVGAGSTSATSSTLVIGSVIGQTAASLLALAMIFLSASRPAVQWRVMALVGSMKRYRNCAEYALPYTLICLLRENLPLALIKVFAADNLVGHFGLTWRLGNLPGTVVAQGIRPLLFQKASLLSLHEVQREVVGWMRILIWVATPLWVLVCLQLPFLYSWGLGENWAQASPVGFILLPPAFLFLIINWMDRLMDAAGAQPAVFRLESLAMIAVVGVFAFALMSGLNVRWSLALFAVTTSLYYLAWIYLVFQRGQYEGKQLISLMRDTVVLAVVTGAIGIIVKSLMTPLIFLAVSGIGFVIYTAALYFSRRLTVAASTLHPEKEAIPS